MKKSLMLLLAVLSLVACRKITPEERISQISTHFAKQQDAFTTQVAQYQEQKRVDYLSLVLLRDLGAENAWTLEAAGQNSLVAEYPGNEEGVLTLLSVSLDDPAACGAVLQVCKAFKDLKIKHKNSILALFYSAAVDSAGKGSLAALDRDLREEGQMASFRIEVSSSDTLPRRTFVLDERPGFSERMLEVLPPYLKPIGDYHLAQGSYTPQQWPLKVPVYRFAVNSEDVQNDLSALTALTFLLNF